MKIYTPVLTFNLIKKKILKFNNRNYISTQLDSNPSVWNNISNAKADPELSLLPSHLSQKSLI